MKTNLMHCLSSVYFVTQPLYAFYLTVRWLANTQSTEKHNTYQLLYIQSVPPVDVLQICPKHVEVD